MSISQTIHNSLSGSGSGTAAITLNADEVTFLQRVVAAAPTVFDGLDLGDTIDVSDIPKLAFVVFNLYKEQLISSDMNVNIINVVDFTLTNLIYTLAPAQSVVLIGILNCCIELLRSNLPVIQAKEVACWNWMRSCTCGCRSCCAVAK